MDLAECPPAPDSAHTPSTDGERSSHPRLDAPCLVCRARKVKCDRERPSCSACIRLEIQCPGYQSAAKAPSKSELSLSADGIFQASGIVKRRIGSCVECRQSKCRCSRTRPTCERCRERGLACRYPGPGEFRRRDAQRPSTASRCTPEESSNSLVSATSLTSTVPFDYTVTDQLGDSDMQRRVSGRAWLFSDSIPQDRRHLLELITAYFDHVHPLRCLGFIHKPTFMYAVERGAVKDEYIDALIYIMCAFGAKYVSWEMDQRLPLCDDENEVPGFQWARQAREMAMRDMAVPSIQNLMALILISEYGASAHGNAIAFVLAGCCHRLARLLGLDDKYEPNRSSGSQAGEQEIRRRLLWSCFVLDSIVGSGVDAHNISKYSLPEIPLPAPDSDFLAQFPDQGKERLRLGDMEKAENIKRASYRGQIIYLVLLRTRVLRLIRRQLSASEIQDPDSPFTDLLTRLEAWYANLPPELGISDLNIYIHKEMNQLGPVFALHFLYHAAMCDLTRVSLPGFKFPLAAAFADVSDDFRQRCRRLCRHHADEVSRLIGIGLQHGNRPFDDTFCFTATYEVTKIQIIDSATAVSRQRAERSRAEASIRCNIRLMTLMGRDGSHAHVRPLLSLLCRFGFRKIALEWHPQALPSELDQAEISGPADFNHLSNVSILRMARAEMKRHQSHSATSPLSYGDGTSPSTTHNRVQGGTEQVRSPAPPEQDSYSVPAAQNHTLSDPILMASTTEQAQSILGPGVSRRFGRAEVPHSAAFNAMPGMSVDGTQSYGIPPPLREGPYAHTAAGAVDSAIVFRDANSFIDASPSNEFSDFSLDYDKLAAEMSDYILWNATDPTQWTNVPPYHPDDDPYNFTPFNYSDFSRPE